MTHEDFKISLSADNPPGDIHPLLTALWHDARGNWNAAHELAQEDKTTEGSWVHAYLHRKEGDSSNADYWYRKAGKKYPACTLNEEWDEIAMVLLHSY